MRDAVGHDMRLTGAGTRDHQQRAIGLLDGAALLSVEIGGEVRAPFLPRRLDAHMRPGIFTQRNSNWL